MEYGQIKGGCKLAAFIARTREQSFSNFIILQSVLDSAVFPLLPFFDINSLGLRRLRTDPFRLIDLSNHFGILQK